MAFVRLSNKSGVLNIISNGISLDSIDSVDTVYNPNNLVDTLYYRTRVSDTDTRRNEIVLDLIPIVSNQGQYNGISMRYMTDSSYNKINDQILFLGYRIPINPDLSGTNYYIDTPYYLEQVIIKSGIPSEYEICAETFYADSGTEFESTVDYIIYSVQSATGKYSNIKHVKIKIDNINHKREVELYS